MWFGRHAAQCAALIARYTALRELAAVPADWQALVRASRHRERSAVVPPGEKAAPGDHSDTAKNRQDTYQAGTR